jgi:hypothetical protein
MSCRNNKRFNRGNKDENGNAQRRRQQHGGEQRWFVMCAISVMRCEVAST